MVQSQLPSYITKRDGSKKEFDINKISWAVRRCLRSSQQESQENILKTLRCVKEKLQILDSEAIHVESLQDIVQNALYEAGLEEASIEYVLFRGKKEQVRKDRPMPDEVKQAFRDSAKYFPSPIQAFQFFDKYSRFNYDKGRRETWPETVKRTVDFLKELSKNKLSEKDYIDVENSILVHDTYPALRVIATAGEAARKNNISIYNCSYLILDCIDALVEIVVVGTCGTGIGYSVESKYVSKFPEIKIQSGIKLDTHAVEDSAEGWADAFKIGLEAWFDGKDLDFDYSLIRPAGSILKTKGGRSSGFLIFKNMLENVKNIIFSKQGTKLTTLNVHDIATHVGNAIVNGGHRRVAMIALFDHNDELMLHCKDGDFYKDNPNRAISNNSAVWPEDGITHEAFLNQMNSMFDHMVGEPGIFSRFAAIKTMPVDRKYQAGTGTNPCQPGFATVLTPDGIRKFADISVGSTVWSGKKWTTVVDKQSTGIKPVFKYETSFGDFIGTDAHMVFQDGERVEAKDANNIDVCVGEDLHDCAMSIQSIIDGIVIGDGSVHGASNDLVYLCIGRDDADYFTSEISEKILKHRPGIQDTAYIVDTTITADELPYTYIRTIPDRYLYANKNDIASFLRGLYTANGSVVAKNGTRVTLKQSSFVLIKQVQQMLSSIGIKSYITTNKATKVKHHNGVYESRESYDLNITTDRFKFKDTIGFIQDYKNNKIGGVSSEKKFITSLIRNSEYLGDFPVFDITVEADEHSYWTAGLLVSNCGEVILRDQQFCNLSQAIVRPEDTKETLKEKIRIATIIGTLQSCGTDFKGLRAKWKENCEEERLLGVDINGVYDNIDLFTVEYLEELNQCYHILH